MTFYAYDQNNSGAYWSEPALTVVVEAATQQEADLIAAANGVDEAAPFCHCCGKRWTLGYAYEYEGPKDHWRIAEPDDYLESSRKECGVPLAVIVYADGRKEVLA